MIKKLFLLPAILGVAGLLMAADSAFAGPGGHSGGGHSSGSSHGGGHVGGGHGGGYYGGGYNHGGYNHGGYYGGGYGLGLYGAGILGGYDPWYDNYSYAPRYSYYNAPAVQYYDPPTQVYAQPAPVVNNYANVRVIVPDPQARVWFDGNNTTSTGSERLFNTPALTMGSAYSYQIRASWMQDGREVTQVRTVSVTPGQTAMVDFSR